MQQSFINYPFDTIQPSLNHHSTTNSTILPASIKHHLAINNHYCFSLNHQFNHHAFNMTMRKKHHQPPIPPYFKHPLGVLHHQFHHPFSVRRPLRILRTHAALPPLPRRAPPLSWTSFSTSRCSSVPRSRHSAGEITSCATAAATMGGASPVVNQGFTSGEKPGGQRFVT